MCDLPLHPIPFNLKWRHLEGILLADPDFGLPGKTDILLGVDIFVEFLCQGQWTDTPGSPSTFKTDLVGSSPESSMCMPQVTPLPLILFPSSLEMICCESSGRLKNGQKINPISLQKSNLLCNTLKTTTHEQKMVISLFLCPRNHMLSHWANPDLRLWEDFSRWSDFYMPRSSLVNLMLWWMNTLRKGMLSEFPWMIWRSCHKEVLYLPMHAVKKESSTTTKIRDVFDASAKSSTGVPLNNTLLVRPTIHPPLLDKLLRFRLHVWILLPISVACIVPLNSPNLTEIYIGLLGEGIPRILCLTTIWPDSPLVSPPPHSLPTCWSSRMPLTSLWTIHWLLMQ